MRAKSRRFFCRGNVEAAFRYARWAPAAAFLAVYLAGGDFTYLTCAIAFSGWPTFKLLNNS